jgi:hypothetical protein
MSVENMMNGYTLTKEGADVLLSLISEDEETLREQDKEMQDLLNSAPNPVE